VAPAAGQHEDVLERDHVDPRRVFLVSALLCDVVVKPRQELFVEFFEQQILAVEFVVDVVFEMLVNTPIFIVGRFAAADAHHPAELLVVMPEEGQQRFVALVVAEIHLLDHFRSDQGMLVKQRVVTSFDAETNLRELFVDM
jgi:hypothetical protein